MVITGIREGGINRIHIEVVEVGQGLTRSARLKAVVEGDEGLAEVRRLLAGVLSHLMGMGGGVVKKVDQIWVVEGPGEVDEVDEELPEM